MEGSQFVSALFAILILIWIVFTLITLVARPEHEKKIQRVKYEVMSAAIGLGLVGYIVSIFFGH